VVEPNPDRQTRGTNQAARHSMSLNNRDVASLVWLAAIIGYWAATRRSVRQSVREIVRPLADVGILVIFALYGLWMCAVIAVAAELGLWNTTMLRDTVVAVLAGVALVAAGSSATSQPHYFRHRLAGAIAATAFLEVYLNLATLDLAWELALQPVLFVALAVSVFGGMAAKRRADYIVALVGVLVLVPPTALFVSQWGQLDVVQIAREFVLPVWMAIGVLPFAFGFAVMDSYRGIYKRLRWYSPNGKVPRYVLEAIWRVYGLDLGAMASEVPTVSWKLVRAASLADALHVVSAGRHDGSLDEAEREDA